MPPCLPPSHHHAMPGQSPHATVLTRNDPSYLPPRPPTTPSDRISSSQDASRAQQGCHTGVLLPPLPPPPRKVLRVQQESYSTQRCRATAAMVRHVTCLLRTTHRTPCKPPTLQDEQPSRKLGNIAALPSRSHVPAGTRALHRGHYHTNRRTRGTRHSPHAHRKHAPATQTGPKRYRSRRMAPAR